MIEHLFDRLQFSEWQVIQEEGRLIVLFADGNEGFDIGQVTEMIARALKAHGAAVPVMEFHCVAAIPGGLTDKASIVLKVRDDRSKGMYQA